VIKGENNWLRSFHILITRKLCSAQQYYNKNNKTYSYGNSNKYFVESIEMYFSLQQFLTITRIGCIYKPFLIIKLVALNFRYSFNEAKGNSVWNEIGKLFYLWKLSASGQNRLCRNCSISLSLRSAAVHSLGQVMSIRARANNHGTRKNKSASAGAISLTLFTYREWTAALLNPRDVYEPFR